MSIQTPAAKHFCDFCNKSEDEVKHLISGGRADICDECVGVCVEVLETLDAEPSDATAKG